MKNQVTNQTELQAQFFTVPNKAIVTEIHYSNGEKSNIITAVPKGVLIDHIQMGVLQALSMQNNIISCKSDVYYNKDGVMSWSMSFDKHFFSNENRIPSPVKQEYVWTSINYLN